MFIIMFPIIISGVTMTTLRSNAKCLSLALKRNAEF